MPIKKTPGRGDTGIYFDGGTTTISGVLNTAEEYTAALRAMADAVAAFDIRDKLKAFERELQAVIESHPQDSVTVEDAGKAMSALKLVRLGYEHLQNRDYLPFVVRHAIDLGMLIERVNVRPFEPSAKIGRGHAKRTVLATEGKRQKSAERKAKFRAIVQRYLNAGHSITKARMKARDDFTPRISDATARNYTKGMKKYTAKTRGN